MAAGKTVLVVEDDPKVASFVQELLTQNNYRVLIANDGLLAIDQTNRNHVDIVLMDIRLPISSGFWFCQALRKKKNTRNIPVVMMSGEMDTENTQRARLAGAVATVQKPFTIQELLSVVEKNSR